jgi:hypothetical protein
MQLVIHYQCPEYLLLGKKEAGQHLARLQHQQCMGGQNKQVQGKLLNISQEEHVQQYRRDNKVLLSELGEQELKPKGESTTSVFLYLVPV